jgi:hypothetical protein
MVPVFTWAEIQPPRSTLIHNTGTYRDISLSSHSPDQKNAKFTPVSIADWEKALLMLGRLQPVSPPRGAFWVSVDFLDPAQLVKKEL